MDCQADSGTPGSPSLGQFLQRLTKVRLYLVKNGPGALICPGLQVDPRGVAYFTTTIAFVTLNDPAFRV